MILRIKPRIEIRKLSILLTIILVTLPVVIAYKADMIKYDYISIIVTFNYAIESSITRFKDFLILIVTFVITTNVRDYQLVEKEHDYTWLLASFVYDIHSSNTTILASRSDTNIASDMMIQKQESITIDRHTDMKIRFNIVDVSIEEEGDNNSI